MSSYMKSLIEKKGFLIAAHRGSFKANIIENTYGSFNAALLEGADLVEIDLIKSKDGVLYVFHDGGEARVFKQDVSVFDLNSNEIDELRFHNQLDVKTSQQMIPLVEYLEYIEKIDMDFMVNIDRCFEYFDVLLPLLDQYNLYDKLLIKAPVVDQLIDLDQYPTKYQFMAIVKTKEDLEKIESYENINTVALELIVNDELTYFDDKELILKLKEKGYVIWLNAITLHDEAPLFYTFDDNTVIKSMDFSAWDTLLSYHADILQTDWVTIMDKYRQRLL